jgi:hypothetical protein
MHRHMPHVTLDNNNGDLCGTQTHANSALEEHSWVHINPLDLGPVHGPFLAALQELNETGVPPDFPHPDTADFRLSLGLNTIYAPSAPPLRSHYNPGCGKAWIYLLHLQVLDFLLLQYHPTIALPATVTPFPAKPLIKNGNGAKVFVPAYPLFHIWSGLQMMKNLANWPLHLDKLLNELKGTAPSAALTAVAVEDSPLESLGPILCLSRFQAQTLASKTYKNLQAIAAGLLWILEVRV